MITIDSRTGSKELLPLMPPGLAKLGRLDAADFCWCGWGPGTLWRIGVERKTVSDLLGSMTSGRLAGEQLPKLLASYNVVYLLVEGMYRSGQAGLLKWRDDAKGKWETGQHGNGRGYLYKAVENFLNTLRMSGLQITNTYDMQHTAVWLRSTHDWWQKEWEEHQSHSIQYQKRDVFQITEPTVLRKVVDDTPGLGYKKGWAVARHFRSAKEFVNTDVGTLAEIEYRGKGGKMKKIGQATAQKALDALAGKS